MPRSRSDIARSSRALLVFTTASLTACSAILGIHDVPEPAEAGTDGGEAGLAEGGPTLDGARESSPNGDDAAIDATVDAGSQEAGDAGLDGALDADASPDAPTDASSCTNACALGATQCGDAGVESCKQDPAGCTAWAPTATCGAHQVCAEPADAGASSCVCTSTLCAENGTVCENAQTQATCSTDTNGCLYVSATTTCAGSESCSGSAPAASCSATCTNSCTSGQKACVTGGLATCATGTDGCLAYGTPVACTNGACTGSPGSASCCTNACTAKATQCVTGGLESCAVEANGCTGWGTPSTSGGACAPSTKQACNTYGTQTCSATCGWGACSCPSAPVCTPGAKQCSATSDSAQTCDACGQWGALTACAANQICSGGCVTAPSCAAGGAGLSNCGLSGTDSCCSSLDVAGGTYCRTYTSSSTGPSGEADSATVSTFRLDKYDVTVGRFAQFVTAWNNGAGYTPPSGSGKHVHLNGGRGLAAAPNVATGQTYEPGWVTTDNASIQPTNANLASCAPYSTWMGSENLPIDCIVWVEAYAFCIWDGGFLPSESEWEYAAAGGSSQLTYPWGSTAPGTGSQYAIYNCYYPPGSDGGSCTGVLNIAPVGSTALGVARWGQLDVAGNMAQWTLDYYANPYANPCEDCAQLTSSGGGRSVRGGDFNNFATYYLSPSNREGPPATYRGTGLGFRCARTP